MRRKDHRRKKNKIKIPKYIQGNGFVDINNILIQQIHYNEKNIYKSIC